MATRRPASDPPAAADGVAADASPALVDARGSVLTEYLIVLVLVVLGLCTGIAGLAPVLIDFFDYQRALLIAPIP